MSKLPSEKVFVGCVGLAVESSCCDPADVASLDDLAELKLGCRLSRLTGFGVLFPERAMPDRTGGGELESDPEEDSVNRFRTEKEMLLR